MHGWKDQLDAGSFLKSGNLEVTILRHHAGGWFFAMAYGELKTDDRVTVVRLLASPEIENAKKEALREISSFSIEMTDVVEKLLGKVAGVRATIPSGSSIPCPKCHVVVEPRMFDPNNLTLWYVCRNCDNKWRVVNNGRDSVVEKPFNSIIPNKEKFNNFEIHEGPFEDPRKTTGDWESLQIRVRILNQAIDRVTTRAMRESDSVNKNSVRMNYFPEIKLLSNINKQLGTVTISEIDGSLWVVAKIGK